MTSSLGSVVYYFLHNKTGSQMCLGGGAEERGGPLPYAFLSRSITLANFTITRGTFPTTPGFITTCSCPAWRLQPYRFLQQLSWATKNAPFLLRSKNSFPPISTARTFLPAIKAVLQVDLNQDRNALDGPCELKSCSFIALPSPPPPPPHRPVRCSSLHLSQTLWWKPW